MPASFALAQRLLEALPEADPLIVLPAILLHDVGYARVPEETHHAGLQDAPGGWDADITRRHELEGARLAARDPRRRWAWTRRGPPASSRSSTATTRAWRR